MSMMAPDNACVLSGVTKRDTVNVIPERVKRVSGTRWLVPVPLLNTASNRAREK